MSMHERAASTCVAQAAQRPRSCRAPRRGRRKAVQTSSTWAPSRDLLRPSRPAVPVAGGQQLAELLRAVGVAALADGEERRSPGAAARPVERGELRRARRTGAAWAPAESHPRPGGGASASSAWMCSGRGAAAAADDVDAVLRDEALEPAGELVGARAGNGSGRRRSSGRPALGSTEIEAGPALRQIGGRARPSPWGRWRS